MSSFICSRRHFDSIARGVINLHQSNNFYPSRKLETYLIEFNRTHYDSQKSKEELLEILTDELAALQVRCVCHQYKSTDSVDNEIDEQLEIMQVKSSRPIVLNQISLYRAICCALYQIETCYLQKTRPLSPVEEGVLNFFETLNAELAEHIVQKLPEFSKARWSIN